MKNKAIFSGFAYYIQTVLFSIYSKLMPVPNRHLPYRFAGGKIYLNIKESPMMLTRVIGLYERNKTHAIFSLLKPGMTFVDVGAHKGYFSLIAAKIVGESGSVLAFEPEPDNCAWMSRSIDLNGYQNIQLYEFAVGDVNEQATLYLGCASGLHTLLSLQPRKNMKTIQIQKRTLDSLLEVINHRNINMIKIDVEGAELEVLYGAEQTLNNNKDIVLLIDLHPQLGVNPAEVCGFLKERGFSIYNMKNPYSKPVRISQRLNEILARR
jgi:FkbM family methyltransferase